MPAWSVAGALFIISLIADKRGDIIHAVIGKFADNSPKLYNFGRLFERCAAELCCIHYLGITG